MLPNGFKRFIESESAGGILLMGATILAMLFANSPLDSIYNLFLSTPVEIRIGPLQLAKPLLLWVNDGLMTVFFFLVGLELKREMLIGEFSDKRKLALPGFGALGGMLIPAVIYVAINRGDAVAMRGWAIPTATDIAFALGVLSLLGPRIPSNLKVLLTSLAIFDDIGAILIIALFYTASISLISMSVAGICIVILFLLNRYGQETIAMYIAVGLVMWVALLKSGVHATLAGVILAMFIPMHSRRNPDHSPLIQIEHDLHPVTAFVILPLFAFCNGGIDIHNVSVDFFVHGVPVGVALGLLVGKQAGVFGFILLAVLLKISDKPKEMGWSAIWGMSALSGIGFTMSLFIGSLAFDQTLVQMVFDERIGIITGSLLSGILGYIILRFSAKPPDKSGR